MKPDDKKRTLRPSAISSSSKVIEKLIDETAPKAKEITFRLGNVGYTRAISIVGSELTSVNGVLNREKSRK